MNSEKITPRPYQKIAINAAVKALQKAGKALVVLATALGKTLVSALVVRKIGGKGIFLVHNNDILEDAMKEYRKVFPKAKLGLYNGYTKDIEGADIVFASFQTMTKNLKRFKRNQFVWMVVDESHHSSADTYRRVIEKFDCKKLGITATPDRMDLQDIRQFFGDEVVNIQLEEAIARGWLPRIEYHLISDESMDDERLQEIAAEVSKTGQRRLTVAEIDPRVFIRTRDEKIAEIVAGYNEKAVVFCRNVKHTENFKKSLPSSQTYHSNNKRDKNKKTLESLRDGTVRRVLAVNAFNEGINVPDVGLIVFARATDSENIFRQQLGRGLRPGKEKLIVLDFVGNIERMRMIRNMTERIANLHEKFTSKRNRDSEGYRKDSLMLSGKGFEFTFTKQVVDLFDVLDRVGVDFYPTWQEAAEAAMKCGITNSTEYAKRYKEDSRLPSVPSSSYHDFPGYKTFFGKEERKFYTSWKKATEAVKKLKIVTSVEYYKRYKEDDHLPSNPRDFYKDFPGWPAFLGRESVTRSKGDVYPTWQEASRAAIKLGIKKSDREYITLYRQDPKLPGNPSTTYSDFPGWPKFLGRTKAYRPPKYSTWKKASRAAIRLKIKTSKGHYKRAKEDLLLPSHPETYYPDFPGWYRYLGKI